MCYSIPLLSLSLHSILFLNSHTHQVWHLTKCSLLFSYTIWLTCLLIPAVREIKGGRTGRFESSSILRASKDFRDISFWESKVPLSDTSSKQERVSLAQKPKYKQKGDFQRSVVKHYRKKKCHPDLHLPSNSLMLTISSMFISVQFCNPIIASYVRHENSDLQWNLKKGYAFLSSLTSMGLERCISA